MKKIVLLTFVSLLICISGNGNAEPAGSELKGPGAGQAPSSPTGPGGPEQRAPAP